MARNYNKYHVTVEQMRLIEWARSWNWAVYIDWRYSGGSEIWDWGNKRITITSPFNEAFSNWLPATDIDYEIGAVDQMDFDSPLSGYAIPCQGNELRINVTFVDGGRHLLDKFEELHRANPKLTWEDWFGYAQEHPGIQTLTLHRNLSLWQERVVSLKSGVLTLSQACLPMSIFHYDSLDRKLCGFMYAVYPDGEIAFEGSSDEGSQTLSASFVVAGIATDSDRNYMWEGLRY